MPDAGGAGERLGADPFCKVRQLALGGGDLRAFAVSGNGDDRRVVAAILQLSETINDDGDHLLLAHISHNAADWLGSLTNESGGTDDGSAAPKGAPDFATKTYVVILSEAKDLCIWADANT